MQMNIVVFLFVYRILKNLIIRKGFERFCIGLDDKNHENNWYWIDGKKAIKTETNWNDRKPINSGNEDCAKVTNKVFKFNDRQCWSAWIALCEID